VTWFYKGEPFQGPSENDYGFVYLVTNLITGKQYIGKKLFWHKRTKILKGKKKRYLVESDWVSYYGSSQSLLEDKKVLGDDQFKRDILHLCDSKGQCSYLESKEQFDRAVLLQPDLYYNDWIIVRVHRKHLNLESTERKTTSNP
jgi:hypothetical protein